MDPHLAEFTTEESKLSELMVGLVKLEFLASSFSVSLGPEFYGATEPGFFTLFLTLRLIFLYYFVNLAPLDENFQFAGRRRHYQQVPASPVLRTRSNTR